MSCYRIAGDFNFITFENKIMLGKNVSLLFYLKRPQKHISGPIPVYLRITIARDVKELSTSRVCHSKNWDKQAGQAIGRSEE